MVYNIRGLQWQMSNGTYSSITGQASLKEMVKTVPSCNVLYLDVKCNISGSTVTPRSSMESELRSAIIQGKALGLDVVLRGGLWSVTETTFMPSNVDEFFRTFGDSHAYWAALAESLGVKAYGVGVEMELLETDAYSSQWNSIINKVRAVFSGSIWYATNWWDSKEKGDKKRDASWMNMLDYICISVYPMLVLASWYTNNVYPATPSIAELREGYHNWPYWGSGSTSFKGTDWLDEFSTLASAHGKQLLIHMGLASFWGAAATPWASPTGKKVDVQGQANWYTSFFEVFGSASYIEGWLIDGAWFPILRASINATSDTQFTIQNKIATEQAVENAFASLSPGLPPPVPKGTLRITATKNGLDVTASYKVEGVGI